MVVGLGLEPDPRALDRDDPKAVRRYKRASRLFRGAEKAFNTIKKLRKRKRKQKGTPKADKIQQRINKLKKRKDRLLEKSRNIKSWHFDRDRIEKQGDKRGDRGRDRDRDDDRGRKMINRDDDRGRKMRRDDDRVKVSKNFFGGRK